MAIGFDVVGAEVVLKDVVGHVAIVKSVLMRCCSCMFVGVALALLLLLFAIDSRLSVRPSVVTFFGTKSPLKSLFLEKSVRFCITSK